MCSQKYTFPLARRVRQQAVPSANYANARGKGVQVKSRDMFITYGTSGIKQDGFLLREMFRFIDILMVFMK